MLGNLNNIKREILSIRAFTLVEVLVSVFILGLLISGIYGVLNIGNLTYLTDMGLLELEQNTRRAMDTMVRELRASYRASIDSGDPSHITFTTPKFSNIEYRYIDSNNDNIRDRIIRQRATETKILANGISDLCFCWDCTNNNCRTDCSTLFTIRIRAAKTAMQKPLTFSLIEQVRLRN